MKTLNLTNAPFLDYVRSLGQEPVILTLGRKPVAVVWPIHNADLETVSLSINPKFLAILERSKRSLYEEGGFSSEEIRREFGLPRASNRKRAGTDGKPKAKRRKPKLAK
jgi:hypothetical protein